MVPTVVGYVARPDALLVRGLALGLGLRGHDVRVVEERRNRWIIQTLRSAGPEPSRQFHRDFGIIQHHTYDARGGAALLEWATRELSLIDVVIVADGTDDELVRWIANITRPGLIRAYLSWRPDELPTKASRIDLPGFDLVLTPSAPADSIDWLPILPAVADVDRDAYRLALVESVRPGKVADVLEAARQLEHGLAARPVPSPSAPFVAST